MAKPNIIVIMTDQQRADLCGREGCTLDTTPTLDRLAREGTWFNRAYTSAPVCAPARVSLLTGRFPSAHAVRTNHNIADARYEQDLIDVLKGAGYSCGLSGKNHSHLQPGRMDFWHELGHNGGIGEGHSDNEREFDLWLRNLRVRIGTQPTPFPVERQCPVRAVSAAQRWIRSLDRSRPFFLWLSFPEPHNPYQVPEPYYSLFPPQALPPATGAEALEAKGYKWQWARELINTVFPEHDDLVPRARSNYLGMLRLIDDQVGRLLAFLEEQRLRDDTILIFTSDHGDFAGEYGLVRKGPEVPEVLMRVPLIATGPGIETRAEPSEAHVSLVDLMPTLCEAIGAELPRGVQGRSLWPLLTGSGYPAEQFRSIYGEQGYGGLHYTADDNPDYRNCLIHMPAGDNFDELNIYSQSGSMRMLRQGDWKLAFDMMGCGQLYNLASDPLELENLFDRNEHAAAKQALLQELLTWILRMQDPLPYPRPLRDPRKTYIPKTDPRNYWTHHG